MKIYGTPDDDTSVQEALLAHVESRGLTDEVDYLMLYKRIPIDSRMCKLPRSLKAQVMLKNKLVIEAIQYEPGGRIFYQDK